MCWPLRRNNLCIHEKDSKGYMERLIGDPNLHEMTTLNSPNISQIDGNYFVTPLPLKCKFGKNAIFEDNITWKGI